MLRRLVKQVCGIMAAALSATAAVPASPSAERIVAVGDLHGDYDAWRAIALAAGVESADGRWAGGQTTLVQLGDVVDREPDSLKIIQDLMRLQSEARKQGGRVIVLVGNHEAMNMTGDLRYTTPGEFAAFATRNSAELRERLYESKKAEIEASYRSKNPALGSRAIRDAWMKSTPLGWVEQRLAWSPDGEIGRWVVRNPAAVLVNGNLFVHGGISAEYSKLSLDKINREVAAALERRDTSPTSIINDPLGPLWYRGLITRDPRVTEIPASTERARPPIEQELATVLNAYGARRIVVGHTPVLSGISIADGGRLVRVDTGNSRYYGGTLSYLEIVGDRLIPHSVPRSAQAGGEGR